MCDLIIYCMLANCPRSTVQIPFGGGTEKSPDNPNSPDLLGLGRGMEDQMKEVVLGPSYVSN